MTYNPRAKRFSTLSHNENHIIFDVNKIKKDHNIQELDIKYSDRMKNITQKVFNRKKWDNRYQLKSDSSVQKTSSSSFGNYNKPDKIAFLKAYLNPSILAKIDKKCTRKNKKQYNKNKKCRKQQIQEIHYNRSYNYSKSNDNRERIPKKPDYVKNEKRPSPKRENISYFTSNQTAESLCQNNSDQDSSTCDNNNVSQTTIKRIGKKKSLKKKKGKIV